MSQCLMRGILMKMAMAATIALVPHGSNAEIKPQSLQVLTKVSNAKVLCGFDLSLKRSVLVKKLSKNKLKSRKPEINKLTAKYKSFPKKGLSKLQKKQKKKTKAKLDLLKNEMKLCKLGAPSATSESHSIVEGTELLVELKGNTPRKASLSYILIELPKKGAVSGQAPQLLYLAGHELSSDTIKFRVSDGALLSEPAVVSFSIAPGSAALSGNAQSLQHYRNQLSEREVRHLLRKVAMGGTPELIQIGVTQGLDALVDALFNFTPDPTVEAQATQVASQIPGIPSATIFAQRYWLVHLLKGSPLSELLAFHLHDHFSTNTIRFDRSDTSSHAIWEHLNLLRADPLGEFEQLVNGMTADLAMNYGLDNRLNIPSFLNQNYARELMELFLVGARRQITGTPNYDERSIDPAARALTGFFTTVRNGKEIVAFSANKHDGGLKTIFPDTAWESTQNFDDQSFVHYVLFNHPESPRYLAGKLFTLLAHPAPQESVIDQLAAEFKASNFNLTPVLKTILKSSAIFSPQAYKVCVDSPVQYISSFVRSAGLPSSSELTISSIRQALVPTGQLPLEPPSVFGWGGCGVNRYPDQSYGEVWLSAQRLLESYNALNRILNAVRIFESSFSFDQVLEGQALSDIETISQLLDKFDVTLSQSGVNLLRQYLNSKRQIVNNVVTYIAEPWDQMSAQRREQKIAGLLQIIAALPQSRAR